MGPNICQYSGSTQILISPGSHRLGLWFYYWFLGCSWSPKAEGGPSWSAGCSWWGSCKCQLSGSPRSDHRSGKGQSSSQFPRSGAKECSKHWTVVLISHASKVMLKILHARLQHYMTQELPDIPAGFRKGRGTRDQIANICWIIEKAREFQKNIYLCLTN